MNLDAKTLLLPALWALMAAVPAAAFGQTPVLEFELEGGATWQSYNDVQIPNDPSGTRFSLAELAGSGPWRAGRIYVTWNLSDRHAVRLLVAPFSASATGLPSTPLGFAGAQYKAADPTAATYTFNSYRLSYRWRFHAGDRLTAWTGLTAKVRYATVALEQGATRSRKDDLGFVPLLHLATEWRFSPDWTLSLDADALAGGPGRAVDASLKLGYELSDGWSVRAGYRAVEGGADVDSVYNFAWLHSAVVSLAWRR